ncbi:MAG: exo-alpha-sialidase [Hyphomicrobium sp.]|nr:exo-alpha-sialidase [Hyphomicrobium sp.]
MKHDGWRHEGSIGSGVQVYQSYDGRQVRNPNTAFSLSDRAPAEVVGGRMGGTRTGLIVTALDASSNTLNYFVSSDDDSFEWGAPTLLTTIAPIFTYGKFHNIPNVDTTPSTNDWIAFGYGAGHIYWISTANNGTTWTSGDCFGGALAGFLGVEAYVERFPGQNKWVMIIRDDTGGNARMSVTTDLKNWPAPVATSLPTGANPLTLIFHGGRLYIYATARRGQPINGATDALVYWDVDPAVVEATSAVGSPTMKLAYAGSTHMLGYLNTVMTPNGYWEASFTSDETELGSANPSASHVVMLSGVQTEVASPAIIATRPNKNLWDNGTLQSVTRAASGSLSDGVIVADRLKWFGAATGTYARQDVPYDIARTMPHKPRKMTTIVSSATTNCGFSMRRYGADHFRMAADAVLTISVHAANTWPNPLFFKVIHRTAKTAGTDIPSPAVQLTGDPKPNGGWFASVAYPTIGMSGVSLGADPSVEYQLYTPLAGGGYDGSICGVKLEFGDTATALEQDDGDMPEHLSRTAEMVTFAPGHVIGAVYPLASGSGGCVLEYEPKDFAPSVTITASSLIVVTAGGSVAVTGLTVAAGTTPGQRRCVLTVTAPGLTQPGALMVDAGGSASFLVSVDH